MLSELLARKAQDVDASGVAHILLLFQDEQAEIELPMRTTGHSWEGAIVELERFRWGDAHALLPNAIRQIVTDALGKKCRRQLEPVLGHSGSPSIGILGRVDHDPLWDELTHFVRRSRRAVTLLGPSGAGKTYYAEAIHSLTRPNEEFVAINCHALTPSLLDAELFGVARGAASDTQPRAGAFERARHGTLFLDEIGDAPPEFQAKLLNAIESRKAWRVGGKKPFSFPELRLIFATNVDILERAKDGQFRLDLLYRMGRLFTVPTLRDRGEAQFGAIVREVFQKRAQSLVGETSKVSAPNDRFIRRLYSQVERLFPGQIRTLGVVLEDAILEAERRNTSVLDWNDIEVAAAQWLPSESQSKRTRLPLRPRLARARELYQQGVDDNASWREALGYKETPKGKKAFREWRTRNKSKIESPEGDPHD
jgi:DNA-binding NtrC family response regulator